MYLSTTQANVVSGGDYVVELDTTQLDNAGVMGSTGNNRIIIARPATYYISGVAVFVSISAATRVHTITSKNGTLFGPFSEGSASAGAYAGFNVSFEAALVASDYIQLQGFHNAGSDQTFYGAAFSVAPSQLTVSEKPTW